MKTEFDIGEKAVYPSQGVAEVIGIDISGSMGAMAAGHTKLELANEGAARSAALLGPGDLLGVEHVARRGRVAALGTRS